MGVVVWLMWIIVRCIIRMGHVWAVRIIILYPLTLPPIAVIVSDAISHTAFLALRITLVISATLAIHLLLVNVSP